MKIYNTHIVAKELTELIEELIHKHMKDYQVPYDIKFLPVNNEGILSFNIGIPTETYGGERECQCSHNDRCDLCWTRGR